MTEKQEREWMKALGSEIRVWRHRRGLTAPQLAEKSGISPSTMGRIERGTTMPSIKDTRMIAKALGLKLSVLIERVESAVTVAADDVTDEETF